MSNQIGNQKILQLVSVFEELHLACIGRVLSREKTDAGVFCRCPFEDFEQSQSAEVFFLALHVDVSLLLWAEPSEVLVRSLHCFDPERRQVRSRLRFPRLPVEPALPAVRTGREVGTAIFNEF